MYNEKYIKDFEEKMYLFYLESRSSLKEISDSYVHQYTHPTYDCTIAFKESLDHYVLKQMKTNPEFLKSQYFKNYLDYINYTFSKRVSTFDRQLEYNTNVIFNDLEARKLILSCYNDDVREKINRIINDNENSIDTISRKIANREVVSQEELNLLADYLYTKKDFSSNLYENYIRYLLNDIKDSQEVKNSPQIIASYIAYLPKIFGDGCENSRILLTNGYSSNGDAILPSVLNDIIRKESSKSNREKTVKNLRLYSKKDKYISISRDELNFSITSDKSLDNSRTMINRDLYWISMVCFHELTHQYQTRKMKSNKFDSSGFAMILRYLILNDADYSNNHDCYEIEIEADELAWKKMYDFIFLYRLKSASGENRKDIEEQLKKCKINQKAVYSRRTFLTRIDRDIKSDYFRDDMKIIANNFQNKVGYSEYFRKMWTSYPMMQKLFTESGQIKTTVLLNENITSSDYSGLDNNIMSSEITNYILSLGYASLKKHIVEDTLTELQAQNLMMNVYNTYHLDKLFVRALNGVDLDQYKETHHNFDFKNIKAKYLEKFRNVAFLVYKERELLSIINSRYPNYNVSSFANPKYAMSNYIDMFKYLYDASNGYFEYSEIEDIVELYESTSDSVLLELASNTKSFFSQNNNSDVPFTI